MKDFFSYFFGQGETQEFALFSAAHLIPILLLILTVLLIARFRKQIAAWKHEEKVRYGLAFAMIVCDMSYYWRLSSLPALSNGPTEHLPIGVCAWAVILGSFMMVGKNQKLFDIIYFWLFSGTVFAVLTPTVLNYCGPTRFRYYQFWLEHSLSYIAIFYMIFVHRMRPTWRSMARSYLSLAALAALAAWVNHLLPGANYLYMARPESAPSVLDILPPNYALRIFIMSAVITLMFVLAYLPWWWKDRRKSREGKEEAVLEAIGRTPT